MKKNSMEEITMMRLVDKVDTMKKEIYQVVSTMVHIESGLKTEKYFTVGDGESKWDEQIDRCEQIINQLNGMIDFEVLDREKWRKFEHDNPSWRGDTVDYSEVDENGNYFEGYRTFIRNTYNQIWGSSDEIQ
tara:strand:- start:468 stop:863 length:396 start_codon:yes stop_codon:yes gene_type:complete